MRRLDLVGQKFWCLTVKEFVGISEKGTTLWKCQCDCGKESTVVGAFLKNGHSKSCGCLAIKNGKLANTTHGMAKTPLHKIWLGIKNRCYNKNTISYKDYGGRGIKICERWLEFKYFHWDMHSEYKIGLTIERKDVNKDYCKENCIWIPRSEQSRNRTNTIWIKTELGLMTVTDAAKKAGVSWFCMYNRHLRNCPIDKLLTGSHKAGRSFTNG